MQKELYNFIPKRKSTRKYSMTALSEELIDQIREFTKTIEPLDPQIKTKFVFLSSGDVKNLLPIKAPHYICIYSETKEGYLLNAGFMLQQMDLYLSKNNIGSCWLGLAKPSKEVKQEIEGLEYVIMLAFGEGIESVYRDSTNEFKRKAISEITNIKDAYNFIEAIRLAPSASNSQPWFISGNNNNLVISREKLNIIRAPLYDKMNCIDIGIALCHLGLTAINYDKNIEFYNQANDISLVPERYQYMISAKVE